MQNDIAIKDEQLRRLIMERVLLGIFFIGLIQSLATIFGHQSNQSTLWVIISLVPIVGATYWYVRKTGKVAGVGRGLLYIAMPVLIYRAYTMGGVWGVTTNWIYLIPVFGALFLGKKEIITMAIICTFMMVGLAIAHNNDPNYALDNLLLVPAFARIIYLLMPLYVISYVIIFYESQRKKYIQEIQENSFKDLQNEKLISIGSMSAGMAHEINNPLMVLQGSVNLLEAKLNRLSITDKEKIKIEKYLGNLKSGIDRIAKIITSVKALSSNSENIKMEEIELSKVIESSLELFKDKFVSHGVRLIKNENFNGIQIKGVQIQLEQILMNFISNSIDEVKEKDNPWIKISAETINHICHIRVSDSGKGIDELVIRQLFDPFFTTKEVGSGTGLGLSLCKTLAENNGGDIHYELYNGNTSFVLKVPLA